MNESEILFTQTMPPRIEEVIVYFLQKGIPQSEAEAFFLYYDRRHWISRRGNPFTGWKAVAYKWVVSVWRSNPLLFDKRA